ncbi:MAG: hypothetical protein WCK02_12860 [Bacteroidota bacterium]
MKTKIFLLFFLANCIIAKNTIAQTNNIDPQMIKLGWTFVSPLIMSKVNDPLTKEIIIKTIPKIIDQNTKAAVLEVTNAIYSVKNIKVLNKEFLLLLEKNINTGISAINKKDYATAVNELVKVAAFTELYIKSGSLGTESATPVSTASVSAEQTKIITTKEINGIIHIGEKNNYLFFMTEGAFSQKQKNNAEEDNFDVSLNNEQTFSISVSQSTSEQLKNVNIELIQENNEISEKIKTSISESIANTVGSGQLLTSEVANCPNFKALKYTYLYNDKITNESSMAYVYVAFQNSTMFIISFYTSAKNIDITSKSFNKFMKTFFIIGVDNISNTQNKKPIPSLPCETNKMGVLTIVNKSTNPYLIYKDGNYLMTIKGKEVRENIMVNLGITNFRADQSTGYAMYPTVNKRPVEFKSPCQKLTINIGFED